MWGLNDIFSNSSESCTVYEQRDFMNGRSIPTEGLNG
jgi:hypothetical protein